MIFEEEDWKDGDNAKQLENSLIIEAKYTENKEHNDTELTQSSRKRKRKRKKEINKDTITVPAVSSVQNVLNKRLKKNKNRNVKHNNTIGLESISISPTSRPSTILPKKKSENTNSVKVSKSDWKRQKLCKMMEGNKFNSEPYETIGEMDINPADGINIKDTIPASRSDVLRQAVTTKLQSAQFRFINEQLYSRNSMDAKKLFVGDSKSFAAYHAGFTQQVSKWPVNPLDIIINFIKKRPSHWIIGDFGCGDARLAASVKNRVHSFDLVSVNERVTVADIAKVPVTDGHLDVAVFCLSLMGTNYVDFLKEANRTLKLKGMLKIAEVASRFSGIRKFVLLMKKLGFDLEREDDKNSHFVMLDFRKMKSYQRDAKPPIGLLKPCVYKKR